MARRIRRKEAVGSGLLVLVPALLAVTSCRDRSAEGSVSGASVPPVSAARTASADTSIVPSSAPERSSSPGQNVMAAAVEKSDLHEDLLVVYTASSQGYLEPCGCYAKQKEMGGIARRATYVDSLRATNTPVLLVEGGDFVGGSGDAGDVIGDVTLKVMKAMGYDIIGLGEAELRLGPDFLKKVASAGVPLAHTNWSHPAVGPAQKDGIMVEKAGRKIGVIGLVDPDLVPADLGIENLSVEPPGPAAAAAATSLRAAGADLILVLGHGDFRSSGRVLPSAGTPDLWVVGHGGKELSQGYRLDDTLILGAGNGGKMVGTLRLALPTESAAQYDNLLYPLHLSIPEKPAIAAMVKTVAPEILHRREPQGTTS